MVNNTINESIGQLLHVMFADVVGSSRLYDQLGDIEARHVISHSLNIASDMVVRHNGRVIKSAGDDILCVFPTADDAVNAAAGILDQFLDKMIFEGVDVNFHIGIHSGNGLVTEDDVFGDTVNVSSRLTDVAKTGQVLLSQQTVDFLCADLKNGVRRYDKVIVKGRDDLVEAYDFVWNESGEETGLIEFTGLDNEILASLKLEILDQKMVLTPDVTPLNLGRDRAVELKILGKMVSRYHADIDYCKGKYILRDHSANGTYLMIDSSEPIFIKNEEFPLSSSGVISLGKKIDDKQSMNIKFSHIFGDE